MRIKINYLQEGCILSEDVFSLSTRPIMKSKSVMTKELIEVLQAFLVKEVVVEKYLVDGKSFLPKEVLDSEQRSEEIGEISFNAVYLEAVQKYKRLFKGWQAGAIVDVLKVREFFIPLLKRALKSPKDIFLLYHYSTKEEYFFHHAISVGLISGYLGEKFQLTAGEIVQLSLAGCLCDAGMAKMSTHILEKKTSLTRDEFQEVKNHPIYSYKMLQKSTVLKKDILVAILQHHERLDGSGYPLKDTGDRIHLYSRIVAVADVYHAMTSERIYRSKHSPYKVLEMITRDDFGKYDIRVLKALETGILNFQIGSKVKLSDSRIGTVMYQNAQCPTRPIVQLETELLDLEKKRELFIEAVIDY